MNKVFVPLVGQHDNIGDVILRRELLDWLRGRGELHVYVGSSDSSYDRALGAVSEGIVLYKKPWPWMLAAIKAALLPGGTAHYVFKPGEIQLTIAGLKEHVGLLPVVAAIRLGGGRVVRVGVGARNFSFIPRFLFLPSVILSNFSAWRDPLTAKHIGHGAVMPDLAFAQGSAAAEVGSPHRNKLAVSLRDDSPYPRAEWLQGVTRAAKRLDCEIVVVSQVLRDDRISSRLAGDLGGRALLWGDKSHAEQEAELRATYRLARLTLSNRLHVLVAALTEGSVPVAAVDRPSNKIDRHFVAAGIRGVVTDTSSYDGDAIADLLVKAAESPRDVWEEVDAARAELSIVEARVKTLLGGVS